MKLITALIAAVATVQAPWAQNTKETAPVVSADQKVTVSARGSDVRYVLFDIFSQAKKSFVVEDTGIVNLFLNLNDVPFDQAVDLICQTSSLACEQKDGIYVFKKAKKPISQTQTTANTSQELEVKVVKQLDPSILDKHLTIRLEQAEIRRVFNDIGKQIGITIEVAPEVKNLKVNAFLVDTSLRFALNSLTQSAKLVYSFTDHNTILVSDPDSVKNGVRSETVNSVNAVKSKITCSQCHTELQKGWKYCPVCGNYVERETKG